MANLADYQKITRVIAGKPFGNGGSGNSAVSSDPCTRATATGTATETALTIGSAILSDGDIFLIHQTRGTGAGQWEINKVASGGGTTSIVCGVALHFTYGAGAQAIKFPLYNELTVEAHIPTAWDGSKGGVEVLCGKTKITVTGAVNFKGSDGKYGAGGTYTPDNGGGFRGGASQDQVNSYGGQGESPTGAGSASSSKNGGGGGGGGGNGNYSAGGGGGHADAGTAGAGSSVTNGEGGDINGSADLITLNLGSGAGGATGIAASNTVSGANGGGIVIFISAQIILSSTVSCNGGGHDLFNYRITGGGGSGGAILFICTTASLGTAQATAIGGVTTDTSEVSGDGANGRIAVHHSGAVTGTTNPTFTDVTDTSLIQIDDDYLNVYPSGYFEI
jgi:hypothetical protein